MSINSTRILCGICWSRAMRDRILEWSRQGVHWAETTIMTIMLGEELERDLEDGIWIKVKLMLERRINRDSITFRPSFRGQMTMIWLSLMWLARRYCIWGRHWFFKVWHFRINSLLERGGRKMDGMGLNRKVSVIVPGIWVVGNVLCWVVVGMLNIQKADAPTENDDFTYW